MYCVRSRFCVRVPRIYPRPVADVMGEEYCGAAKRLCGNVFFKKTVATRRRAYDDVCAYHSWQCVS